MFCLKVIIAHPDYKYPYAEVIVEHFESNEKAEIRLNEIKLKYNKEFGLENMNLFDMSEEQLSRYIYEDSYMDQIPFDFDIFEVKIS
jgi:hypothetical protein